MLEVDLITFSIHSPPVSSHGVKSDLLLTDELWKLCSQAAEIDISQACMYMDVLPSK